ncbi:MAG: hypothetical protein K2F87_06630, partial [Muribaculaceae bacterium]|nr:hypothetical protein [Muribaculaceae bacterium]
IEIRGDKNGSDSGGSILFGGSPTPDTKTDVNKEESKNRLKEIYGEDKLTKQSRDAAKLKYAVLLPSQFDDHEIITLLERTPTYNRDPKFNEEISRLGRQQGQPFHSGGGFDERPVGRDSADGGLKIEF